jgi:hypothetical protein
MSEYFTYIIRSSSKEAITDNTNSCIIKLGGLTQQFKYFEVEVIGFYLTCSNLTEFPFSTVVEIRASDLSITNGYDTLHKGMKTLSFFSLTYFYPPISNVFVVENFNNKFIRFEVYDEFNELLQENYNNEGAANYNNPWTLVFKMRGITKAF